LRPDGGADRHLPRGGRRIGADAALACGLVGRVVPPADLDGSAAPLAVRAARRALALADDLPLAEALAAIEGLAPPAR